MKTHPTAQRRPKRHISAQMLLPLMASTYVNLATARAIYGLSKAEVGRIIQGGLLTCFDEPAGRGRQWLVRLADVADSLRAGRKASEAGPPSAAARERAGARKQAA
jgi:hypothetical protein